MWSYLLHERALSTKIQSESGVGRCGEGGAEREVRQDGPRRGEWKPFVAGVIATTSVVLILAGGSRLAAKIGPRGLPVESRRENLAAIMEADPTYFWALRPNLVDFEFSGTSDGRVVKYRVTTNAHALRNPPIGPKGARFRILAMGDSTTFGQYVSDEEAWPAQLQRLLDPEGERVEVINAGLIGASSIQGLCYLHGRGLALDPDLVIVTYGFNDRGMCETSDMQRVRDATRSGFEALAVRSLRNLRLLIQEQGELQPRVTPGEYLDALIAIKEACDAAGAAVLYVVWPGRPEVEEPEVGTATNRPLVFEAGRLTGSPVVDLLDAFVEAPQPVYVDLIHANARGCRVAAERLAEAVSSLFLTTPPTGNAPGGAERMQTSGARRADAGE